jgi:hypothetical protein
MFNVDVYVFDLENQRMYQRRGDEREVRQITASLLDELMTDRARSGTRKAAEGAATVAGVASVQPASSGTAAVSGPTSGSKTQSEPLRVAILPFATVDSSSTNLAEGELERVSREYIGRRGDLDITYSYYQPGIGGGPALDSGSLWRGGFNKLPRTSEIYAVADKLDANVALTYFHAPRAGGFIYDLFLVDVYVFDIEYERMYHGRGDERDYKNIMENLFDDLMADRQKAGAPGTAGGAAVVAGASSQQPVMVNTAAVAQPPPDPAARSTVRLEDGQLSHKELIQYLSGNTVSGRTERFIDFHIYYSPDGKLSGQAKGTRYDAGTWQAYPNATYCRRWDRWLSGARECFKVFLLGANRIQFQKVGSDRRSNAFTLRLGDPKNLKGRI